MARCNKYGEDECIGHDCIGRVGTPCIFDTFGKAGTEDIRDENIPYNEELICLKERKKDESGSERARDERRGQVSDDECGWN